jgi:hypothetical protein
MAAQGLNLAQLKRNVYRKCNVTNGTNNSIKENVVLVRGVLYKCNENGSLTKMPTQHQIEPWKDKSSFVFKSNHVNNAQFSTSNPLKALPTLTRFSKINETLRFPTSNVRSKLIKNRFRLVVRCSKPRSLINFNVSNVSIPSPFSAKRSPPQSRYKWVRGAQVFRKVFVQSNKPTNPLVTKETVVRQLGNKALKSSIDRLRRKSKQKLATNNQKYCMYFCRFGRCNKESTCPFKHDPDKVAICTRYDSSPRNLHLLKTCYFVIFLSSFVISFSGFCEEHAKSTIVRFRTICPTTKCRFVRFTCKEHVTTIHVHIGTSKCPKPPQFVLTSIEVIARTENK